MIFQVGTMTCNINIMDTLLVNMFQTKIFFVQDGEKLMEFLELH